MCICKESFHNYFFQGVSTAVLELLSCPTAFTFGLCLNDKVLGELVAEKLTRVCCFGVRTEMFSLCGR